MVNINLFFTLLKFENALSVQQLETGRYKHNNNVVTSLIQINSSGVRWA
jgi:hypothetical protein